jgi:DNA polymerase-3 subunit chi
MAKLELHPLAGDKRALDLAKLVEHLHRSRRRLVIWVADDGRRQILDDYLWTFRKLSFVPHQLWQASLGEIDEEVVLVGEPANPNRADVLVVGDDLPPGDWAASFAEVHDLVPQGDAGKERGAWWEAWKQEQKG